MNDDLISRKWLMECVDEGWIKFDTEKDKNRYIHLVRDIAPSAQPETHEERTETHACDCISRKTAIDAVEILLEQTEEDADVKTWNNAIRGAINSIKHHVPSAQPEQKKGKWIKKLRVTKTEKYISYDSDWYCSCCGTKYDPHIAEIVNFCYVCGADMREENDAD